MPEDYLQKELHKITYWFGVTIRTWQVWLETALSSSRRFLNLQVSQSLVGGSSSFAVLLPVNSFFFSKMKNMKFRVVHYWWHPFGLPTPWKYRNFIIYVLYYGYNYVRILWTLKHVQYGKLRRKLLLLLGECLFGGMVLKIYTLYNSWWWGLSFDSWNN